MKKVARMFLVVAMVLFVGVANISAAPLEKVIVAISVDDGDRTLYEYIYSLLKAYDMTFTAYLVAGWVGDEDCVSWDQAQEMHDYGVEIGNHSWNHLDPTGKTYAAIYKNITRAQNAFAANGIADVVSYAYPFGIKTPAVVRALKALGFENGRGSFDNKRRYNIPVGFNQWWVESISFRTPLIFEDIKPDIDKAEKYHRAIDIVLHKASPGATGEYELDLYELEKLVIYLSDLRDQGLIEILTVSQAVEKLLYYKSLP